MGQCPKVDYTANVYGGLGGVCRLSMQYLWLKGCKNHRETLYSSRGKIVYVVGKSNIYLQIAGKSYSYYRGFPTTYIIFPFEAYMVFL